VIFDVEVAFFFPWAVVFGKVNALANLDEKDPQRSAIVKELVPADPKRPQTIDPQLSVRDAKKLGWLAFWDLLVFFGVLLVGFAYLWKRGDLDWVRAATNEARLESGPTWSEAPAEPVAAQPTETANV